MGPEDDSAIAGRIDARSQNTRMMPETA